MRNRNPLIGMFDSLFSSLQNLLPPKILKEVLDGAGQKLGLEVMTSYRLAKGKNHGSLTSEDYIRAMVNGGICSARPITVRRTFFSFDIDAVPILNEPERFVPILSGFFRSAATNQFGPSRVVISAGPRKGSFVVTVRVGIPKPLRSRDMVTDGCMRKERDTPGKSARKSRSKKPSTHRKVKRTSPGAQNERSS